MKKAWAILGLCLSILPAYAVYHHCDYDNYNANQMVNGVRVVDNTAFVTDAHIGLEIFDVSDPQRPCRIGTCALSGCACSATLDDTLAYVANASEGLQIVDIADLHHPRLLSTCRIGETYNAAIGANHICVLLGAGYMYLVDVSNPRFPQLLNTRRIASCSSLDVIGTTVFTAYAEDYPEPYGAIISYDISNPRDLVQMDSFVTLGPARGIDLVGSIAYVACEEGGLAIYDVSTPARMNLIGQLSLPYIIGNSMVRVVGTTAYIIDYLYGLEVVDVSDPAHPQLTGSYNCEQTSYAAELDCANGVVYIAETNCGLELVDVSDPSNPRLAGQFEAPGWTNRVMLNGHYAYASNGTSGVNIYDVSDPQNSALAGIYPVDNVRSIVISGNTAYTSDGGQDMNGFWLESVDISDPTHPRRLGGLNLYDLNCSDGGTCLASGDQVYLLATDIDTQAHHYLWSIDVSDPANMHTLGEQSFPDFCTSAVLSGNLLYAAARTAGLCIYDVSDPAQMTMVGQYQIDQNAMQIALVGTTAYIAEEDKIQVFDVSDPTTPTLVTTLTLHPRNYITNCCARDGYLFVADNEWNEIGVYDISNPQQPQLLQIYPWNLTISDMRTANHILYTANNYHGFNILDFNMVSTDDANLDSIADLHLICAPNPTSSTATLRYSLPNAGRVELCIYNVKGQLVRKIMDNEQVAGQHQVLWDGRDTQGANVASGVYFWRLSAAGHEYSRKMVYLK